MLISYKLSKKKIFFCYSLCFNFCPKKRLLCAFFFVEKMKLGGRWGGEQGQEGVRYNVGIFSFRFFNTKYIQDMVR